MIPNEEIVRRLQNIRAIATRDRKVRNEIIEVRPDEVVVASEQTDEPRRIRYDWIRGQVENYPHGSVVQALREILGIGTGPATPTRTPPTAGIERSHGAGSKKAHVVGLFVVDSECASYLLTTYRPSDNLDNPCALWWDANLGRWTNTSETRAGKDTAIHLMEELCISTQDCHITHHYMFKLIRSAWHDFEDVLYDRIRKN